MEKLIIVQSGEQQPIEAPCRELDSQGENIIVFARLRSLQNSPGRANVQIMYWRHKDTLPGLLCNRFTRGLRGT